MTSDREPLDRDSADVGISAAVARAAEQVVSQAVARVLSSDLRVASPAEGKRILAEDDRTEKQTDAIQRFVGLATPVARIAARGARFTRIPWVLVVTSTLSIGVTVKAAVRELQVLAAFLAYRFEQDLGAPPEPALLQKLTLELYLSPRRTPDVSDFSLPLVRLARRWILSGAFGRNTRRKTGKALDRAAQLDLATLAARARR